MATEFRPGDRVRLLTSPEQGEVVQVRPNGRVLVLVEDLFEVEYDAREVVLSQPRKPSQTTPQATQTVASVQLPKSGPQPVQKPVERLEGLYVRLLYEPQGILRLLLANTATWPLSVVAYQCQRHPQTGAATGWRAIVQTQLAPGTEQFLLQTHTERYEREAQLHFQLLACQSEITSPEPPLAPAIREFRLRTSHIKQASPNPAWVPILTVNEWEGKAQPATPTAAKPAQNPLERAARAMADGLGATLRPINAKPAPAQAAQNHLVDVQLGLPNPAIKVAIGPPPPDVVDLHIQRLVGDPRVLKPDAMLKLQLDRFEQCLDQAIAHSLPRITFIHGAGKGILRREIESRLEAHPAVLRHSKADPVAFGGGATIAHLKEEEAQPNSEVLPE